MHSGCVLAVLYISILLRSRPRVQLVKALTNIVELSNGSTMPNNPFHLASEALHFNQAIAQVIEQRLQPRMSEERLQPITNRL